MNIVHLHTHSDYSLLDGLAKINSLVAKASKLGMPALALTDHGVMYGTIKFYKACKEAGIKPIIGCEVYISPRKRTDKEAKIDAKPYHLTLLVKNLAGYKNLLKIVSESHLVGFYYKPRIDKEFLAKHSNGIICLSGCPAAEISRAVLSEDLTKAKNIAKEYIDIFGRENFFFEIQPHKLAVTKKTNHGIIQLAQEFDIPLVATNDIHYLNHEDKAAHEVLLAVNTGKDMDDNERMSLQEADLYMMSKEEMLEALPDQTQAINQSLIIADLVDLDLPLGQNILPHFPVPHNLTSMEYLTQKSQIGFKERYQSDPNLKSEKDQQVDPSARLKYELEVIEKTGFADYFLIVSDFVSWAKEQGIGVGPGRGSAAGSIVAYCLNITDLDPLEYQLLFERFLNPDRIAMPDIDLDFADDRRGEVIDYIKQKYGDDHVAQIITFGVMKARLATRDVARSLGFPYEVGDKIAKLIPVGLNLDEAMKNVTELQNLFNDDEAAKKVIEMSFKLEGVARHASTHAAGVVISKEPLVEYVPLQRSTKASEQELLGANESATTQYDMVDVESIGLLKIDILGLANLTIIKNALRIIKKVEGKEIDIKTIPLDDKKTFNLLARGETIGVFQLESDGMRHYIKELRPTRIEDIMAMVSLYRPGPMELIPDYINAKHGKKEITYIHPKLKNILADTYGIAVYQEQILQMARDIAGFSYGEADVLRKAIGKKIRSLLLQQRKNFVEGAVANGTDKKTAEKLFDFAEPFARYGFNRAHAASYALIAYQTAYLKAHFPEPFMAALLTSEHKSLDKIALAISESERMGIKVLPPSINESFVEFGVVESIARNSERVTSVSEERVKRVIRFGLGAIKNVGEKAAELIVKEREKGVFSSFEDFLTRIGGQIINKKVVESLAKSGALNGLVECNRVLAGIEAIIKYSQNVNKQKAAEQSDLFGTKIKVAVGKLELPEMGAVSKKQKLQWEKELLGIYISDHPLKEYLGSLDDNVVAIANITENIVGNDIRIAGVVASVRKITTKNKQTMAFVQVEDLSGTIEVIVFPRTLEKNATIWNGTIPLAIDGVVNSKDGIIKIIANNAYDLSQNLPPVAENKTNGWQNGTGPKSTKVEKSLTIIVPSTAKKSLLEEIKKALLKSPGKTSVFLMIPGNGDYTQIKTKAKVNPTEELIEFLENLVGSKNVSLG